VMPNNLRISEPIPYLLPHSNLTTVHYA
jgi:hypothetical protein